MDPQQLRKKLQPWIEKRAPQLVLLFGSTVWGEPGPEPDLDIAVLFANEANPLDVIDELSELLERDDIDLMVLNRADPIARLAACEGEVIYEKERGDFERFASLATRQFMDNEKFDRARTQVTDEFMRNALTDIEQIVKKGEASYLENRIDQAVLERQIERLVEAAMDAAAHLLREKFKVTAATYREAFLELGRRGILASDLAKNIAPAAGLRNVISHQYDDIDPKRVFSGAVAATKHFPAFMKAIQKSLA